MATASAQFGPATGTYTPGVQRVAFALTNSANRFIYAPTAIYVSRGLNSPAQGPFLTPADPTTVAPPSANARPKMRPRSTGPGNFTLSFGSGAKRRDVINCWIMSLPCCAAA